MTLDELAKHCQGKVWYLGTVYTVHPVSPHAGYREAVYLGNQLLKHGVSFYSPIIHWHNIALEGGIPNDHDYWMAVDEPMMRLCDGMIYCVMENHEKSRGLKYEVERFKDQGKPVVFWQMGEVL